MPPVNIRVQSIVKPIDPKSPPLPPLRVENAFVYVEDMDGNPIAGQQDRTNSQGIYSTNLENGLYSFVAQVFGQEVGRTPNVEILEPNQTVDVNIDLDFQFRINSKDRVPDLSYINQGDMVLLEFQADPGDPVAGRQSIVPVRYDWHFSAGNGLAYQGRNNPELSNSIYWHPGNSVGPQTISVTVASPHQQYPEPISLTREVPVIETPPTQIVGNISATLNPTRGVSTNDQALWAVIRNRTRAISFASGGYGEFINRVLCSGNLDAIPSNSQDKVRRQNHELLQPIHGVGAYELLKTATEIFLLMECGTVIGEYSRYDDKIRLYDENDETNRGIRMPVADVKAALTAYLGSGTLPYIKRVLDTAFPGQLSDRDEIFCKGILSSRARQPLMLELIWSYWHEEGMLVQTMNALSLRFQNRRRADRDPLANLEIAPLYPVNNLLWGYIQDETHRLSVVRRNYEYNHHYGIGLVGRAINDFRPADPRSRFLEGFHNLLYVTTLFYKQADDTTVRADPFPLLNALREVHLILSEGAHNQFGDLPWTARVEMLIQQWILSRPELREFLQSRAMVPYREPWMPPVDAMKQLQGWTDVSVTHFNDLATYGEMLLLSIRYGDWSGVTNPESARNWADYWRPEIQGYIHAYRTATGVDLATIAPDSQQVALRNIQPSELLRQRLPGRSSQPLLSGRPVPALPASQTMLPPSSRPALPQGFRERRQVRRQNGNN